MPSCVTTSPMKHQRVIIHFARRRQFSFLTSTFPRIVLATPPTTKMTSHGSIIYQRSLASSMVTSMVITVPGMIMTLQPLEVRCSTAGWKYAQIVLTDASPTRATRSDQGVGISTPDISLVDTVMAHRFSW